MVGLFQTGVQLHSQAAKRLTRNLASEASLEEQSRGCKHIFELKRSRKAVTSFVIFMQWFLIPLMGWRLTELTEPQSYGHGMLLCARHACRYIYSSTTLCTTNLDPNSNL